MIYDKWLYVKLPECANYITIISGQMALEVKMLSDTITVSTTSKYEGLQKPFSRTLIEGHLDTPDGRPDRRMDGRTTDRHKSTEFKTAYYLLLTVERTDRRQSSARRRWSARRRYSARRRSIERIAAGGARAADRAVRSSPVKPAPPVERTDRRRSIARRRSSEWIFAGRALAAGRANGSPPVESAPPVERTDRRR